MLSSGEMKVDNEALKTRWLKRRKNTTFVFYTQSFLLGVEYSLTFTYLYLYLKDVLKTDKAIFFYSAISTVFLLSMIVASLVFGKLFDKFRNLRQMFIFSNVMIFIGNLLYCIPLSPWLLFFGRLLAGIGGASRPIMSGEIVRCYTGKDIVTQLLRLGMAFGIGFIAGPGMNFFFLKADFMFLGIHFTYINSAVLMLVFVALAQFLASIFFVSDLSKEYDPKGEAEKNDSEKIDSDPPKDESSTKLSDTKNMDDNEKQPLLQSGSILYQSTGDARPNMWNFFKSLAKHKKIAVIFMFSGFYFFMDCLYDIWQPIAFVQFIGWGNFEINLVNFGYGICSIIFFIILYFVSPSQMGVLYLTKVTMVENMALVSIFMVWKLYNASFELNVGMSVLYCFFFAMTILMEEVFLINALAQLVSTDKQSFAEGVRLSCSRTGALTSLLISPVLFEYLEYVCPVFVTIMIIFLFIFHFNQHWYINPKVIVF